MSWKYSSSYLPRDHSSSRDSSKANFGFSNSKLGFTSSERQSRWSSSVPAESRIYRNPVEAVEHSPVWAKKNVVDGPSSVQKLKERYNADEVKREIKPIKKAETKDLSSSRSIRPYGRSLTSYGYRESACETGSYSKFRRSEKALEPEKKTYGTRAISSSKIEDNCKVSYMPTATSKTLTRKYSDSLNQTALSLAAGERFSKNEKAYNDEDTIITVTRGTSPTPITSSVYLRSRRSDYGLEKKVPKPRKKPEMIDKEIQTDKDISLYYSKYCNSEGSGFSKPWSSYSDKYSLHKSNFGFTFGQTEAKRSISREESSDPTTPELQHKSLTMKPPSAGKTPPISPVKESDKKIFIRKSSPPNIGSPLKLDCAKTESVTNPNSPTHSCYSLQLAITKTNTLHHPGASSPKVTDNHSSDMDQVFDDVSSLSESSEEETSTDEETNPELVPAAMTIKKSITNFLQNIPNIVPQCQSKTNLYQRVNSLSPQQINFRRTESDEKAWWMENTERPADDIPKMPSMRLMTNQDHDVKETKTLTANNFLSPPYLINRQFSNDKDWLKSCDDLGKIENHSPSEDRWNRKNEFNSESLGKGPLLRDEINSVPNSRSLGPRRFTFLFKPLRLSSAREIGETSNSGEENSDVSRSFEHCNKFSENSLGEDTSNQMKFNEQSTGVFKDEMKYLGDFPRERSVKNVSLKLQNGLGSPIEDKNHLEPGDMSGMISKAKAGLAKSKSKLDIKKSSSREMSPKITDAKSEIDLYWKELADSLDRPLRLCDLDFTELNSDDEVDMLGNFKMNGEVPPPPPMLILPVPNKNMCAPAPPMNANQLTTRTSRAPAPPPIPQIVKNKKTVKLFWKEVKDEPAIQTKMNDGTGQIWDELTKVKVDTQKLEYLFESRAKDLLSKKQQEINKNKEIIVLDPKRSNAINIGMTKLPPPRAIKTAILKMDSTVVNKEGIEKLLTMLPTEEEKVRIQDAQNSNPDVPLGSAEQFLLTLASINELEARLRLWAFKLNFETSEKEICEPLMDLKQGMEILKTNKTFRGILSTLLSVGNFLNGYDVKGFQIEYLSKVPEVKDTVHKHSLLHHLCIIVMEKFPDSTDLYSEIGAVTRASKVDFDELASNLKKIEEECKLSWKYLKMIAKHEGHTAMKVKMSDFLADCAERIIVLGKVHRRIMSRFQKFAFWLGVPMNRISTTRPNEIFKVISEFALEYRTTRDRVLQQIKKINREKSRTRNYQAIDANDTIGRKMNSREEKDDAMLRELLRNETSYSDSLYNKSAWRKQRRDTKFLLEDVNNNDEEILETLIKTANQTPSSRATLKERRRSRTYDRYCK